ncbi:MAG: MFS transporter, partial [Candidatus Korarchaeota archaeon]|nr:MFS transporter [Candidatus Korarchaeota archaeon]
IQGAAAAATWPVLMSVLVSAVPQDRMGAAMGVFGASFGLGMSLGPVLGPALASVAGIHFPFVLSFLLASAAALAALGLPETRGGAAERGIGGISDPRLASLSLVAFSLLFCMGALVVIFPRYMTDELGLGMGEVALAMALASLTYTFLQPAAGRVADAVDKRVLVVAGLPAAAVSVLLAGNTREACLIYAYMLLFGFAGAFVFPASNAMVGLIAPPGREGTYTGFYNAMLSMGVTVSPIAVGLVADASGYSLAFATPLLVASAATMVFAFVFYGGREG